MPSPTPSPVLVLHAHSQMSMLDGASPVEEYVSFAKNSGHPICSCTDHGWLTGVYDLITKSSKAGIRPAPGCEFYLTPHPDHKFAGDEYKYFHLTVWAYNQKGYSNLVELGSKSWREGRPVTLWGKPRPRITWADLADHREGLLVGSGCIEGPIGKCLLKGELDQARINARMLKDIFGDKLFFELMPGKVDRDYVKGKTVTVVGDNGVRYNFLPTDILVTDRGEMTAAQALEERPSEVLFVKPNRVQDGLIEGGDFEIKSPIDESFDEVELIQEEVVIPEIYHES